MRKATAKSKKKPADALLKTSKKKDIELTEKELDKVSGGVPGRKKFSDLTLKGGV